MKETDTAVSSPIVVWLRDDLRLDDNPALAHAVQSGRPVVPLVVLDEETEGLRPLGGAHRWWLHHSLEALAAALKEKGSGLVLRRGATARHVPAVLREAKAEALFINRRYSRAGREVDAVVRRALGDDIAVEVFDANLLYAPDAIRTKTGSPYKVFTPFRRAAWEQARPRDPLDPPQSIKAPEGGFPRSDDLRSWDFLPIEPDWSGGFVETWMPGEAQARKRFAMFCDRLLADYQAGRLRPAMDETSRMSPHLRWGEISPARLWKEASAMASRRKSIASKDIETFLSELTWRDFNYHLLDHFDDIPDRNFDRTFDALEWRDAPDELRAWQRGQTGYPIVDAGMRQLWKIGWLHNRLRMIVGSFLTRDLLIHWKEGEAWFWDALVDGDIANNTTQWQWIAGTGIDPQPFFRIFNPVAQSRKFDAEGDYIRRYVPELSRLPKEAIHAPWEADEAVLAKAGVKLGETYPKPMVDHAAARDRAMRAYRAMRGKR